MYAKSRIKFFTVSSAFAIVWIFVAFSPFAYAQVSGPGDAPAPGDCGPGSNAGACPSTASTSGALLRDGVFGCSASKYQNPGSLVAVGGVYVPVNDAAVTLNTGYLVYKECVLDGVVSAIKNGAVADLQKQVIRSVATSRGGNPQYLENFDEDLKPRRGGIVLMNLSAESLAPMCDAFKRPVQNTIARGYLLSENARNEAYKCPFPTGGTTAEVFSKNAVFSYSRWFASVSPSGNIYGATAMADARVRNDIERDDRNIREMISWGRGVFPALDNNQDPLRQNVLTPGYIIADSLSKMIGLGTDILLNANEIDQVNGALQAGLQSSIVADTVRGLTGFARSQNGQASYLDRMTAEAAASVRTSAVNAALGILSVARQVETVYKQAKEAIANTLTNAIQKLRDAERTCWAAIVPKVEEKAAAEGASLRIATSTDFSQAVIDAQIQPLASATIRDLRVSEAALALINQLIAGVTNTSSTVAQRAALERLDSMVANNQLHSLAESQAAQKQKDEIIGAVGTLLEETIRAWAESTDPSVGWCNINNVETINRWFNAWKQ